MQGSFYWQGTKILCNKKLSFRPKNCIWRHFKWIFSSMQQNEFSADHCVMSIVRRMKKRGQRERKGSHSPDKCTSQNGMTGDGIWESCKKSFQKKVALSFKSKSSDKLRNAVYFATSSFCKQNFSFLFNQSVLEIQSLSPPQEKFFFRFFPFFLVRLG